MDFVFFMMIDWVWSRLFSNNYFFFLIIMLNALGGTSSSIRKRISAYMQVCMRITIGLKVCLYV